MGRVEGGRRGIIEPSLHLESMTQCCRKSTRFCFYLAFYLAGVEHTAQEEGKGEGGGTGNSGR